MGRRSGTLCCRHSEQRVREILEKRGAANPSGSRLGLGAESRPDCLDAADEHLTSFSRLGLWPHRLGHPGVVRCFGDSVHSCQAHGLNSVGKCYFRLHCISVLHSDRGGAQEIPHQGEPPTRNRACLGGYHRRDTSRDVLGPIGICGVVLVLAGTMWGQRLELRSPQGVPAATRKPEKVRTPTA